MYFRRKTFIVCKIIEYNNLKSGFVISYFTNMVNTNLDKFYKYHKNCNISLLGLTTLGAVRYGQEPK